jgi:nucleoside-diphosphate-sugar epimerase
MSASGQRQGAQGGPDDFLDRRSYRLHPGERVIITGASGFTGTNLVQTCLRRESRILNLDPLPPRNDAHRAVWNRVDPLDSVAVSSAVTAFAPTLVCHLGAGNDLHGKTLADYAHNIEGVQTIIDTCNATPNVRRVIVASSRLVCRMGYHPTGEDDYCPTTSGGESKMVGELIVRNTEHRYERLIVRPTSIWEPSAQCPTGTASMPLRAVATSTSRDCLYASRLAMSGIPSISWSGSPMRRRKRFRDVLSISLTTRRRTSLRCRNMIQRYTNGPRIRTIPRSPLALAARVGDVLQHTGWSEPPLPTFRLNTLSTEMVYDLTPLQDAVGPLPHSLADGVRDAVAWTRRNSAS